MTPDQILARMTRTDPSSYTTVWQCPCGGFSAHPSDGIPPGDWLADHTACVERPAVCPVCLLVDDGHTHCSQRVDWINGEPPTEPTIPGYEHTPKDLPPLAVASLVEAVEANTEAVRELSAAIRVANEQSAGLRAFLARRKPLSADEMSHDERMAMAREAATRLAQARADLAAERRAAPDIAAAIEEARRGGESQGLLGLRKDLVGPGAELMVRRDLARRAHAYVHVRRSIGEPLPELAEDAPGPTPAGEDRQGTQWCPPSG